PYLQKWSLGVQRQLPAGLLLEASYVGSKGTHLLRTRDINQPLASAIVASGQVSPNAVRPYLGLASINTYETTANSIYHSLQVSAVRRFSGGFSLQGSYTFSKIIDNTATPINSYADNRIERGMSSFDRTHIFVGSYVWELPLALRAQGWRRQALH